ncbi:MAG TPA: hypothetical protein IAC09_08415 [Candidatus Cryptobacteroides intestinipullorum]|nr:hypothetical protein [Candidatus Cryptobacteroides intestinipullorum]
MKHSFSFFLAALSLTLLSSCTKVESDDPADDFVGTYNVSVIENVVWGYDSGTLNDNGTFIISKLSANRVQVRGYISTEGEVVGSMVYFEGSKSSDSEGYFTTSYGPGTLSGNVLTFTANQTGQLASNGVLYPYRNTSYFTAIKQN